MPESGLSDHGNPPGGIFGACMIGKPASNAPYFKTLSLQKFSHFESLEFAHALQACRMAVRKGRAARRSDREHGESDSTRCRPHKLLTDPAVVGRFRSMLMRYHSASHAKEHEPDDRQDQDRKPGRDREQCEHRRARLGLPRFGRSFDDLTVSFRCHGDLSAQVPEIPAIAAPLTSHRMIRTDVPSAVGTGRKPLPSRVKRAKAKTTVNAVGRFSRSRCFKPEFPVLSSSVPSVA